jgi:hypothetical protein
MSPRDDSAPRNETDGVKSLASTDVVENQHDMECVAVV